MRRAGKLACLLVSNRQVNQPFSDWLRKEMRRRGWEPDGTRSGGRTALAAQSGVHISVISRALNEGRTPDLDSLRLLGQAFGYNLGEMLVFAGRAERDELPVSPNEPPVGAGVDPALLADASTLDAAEVQRVRDFIKGIKSS